MATFEVIVQTRHGERSTIVEADTRQQAYANAGAELGGVAVDSRRLYDPAEQQQNAERAGKIIRLAGLQGKQNNYETQQAIDAHDAARGHTPSPSISGFRAAAPTEDDLAAIARLRQELGWE